MSQARGQYNSAVAWPRLYPLYQKWIKSSFEPAHLCHHGRHALEASQAACVARCWALRPNQVVWLPQRPGEGNTRSLQVAHAGVRILPICRLPGMHEGEHKVVIRTLTPARLSAGVVAEVVKRCARAAGLDPANYAGHSLRADLDTSAATAAGVSERAIIIR